MEKNRKLYLEGVLFFLVIFWMPAVLFAQETIKNLPSRNIYFTGRIDYLNYVQKSLAKDGMAYLVGYGGIGKTQIAKEYAHIHAKEYDLVWWFDLRRDLQSQYKNLLTYLGNSKRFKHLLSIDVNHIAPSVIIDFTNTLLANSKYRWLLIYDNALDSKELNLPRTGLDRHHVIITTREQQFFGDNVLLLKPFADKESESFLAKIHPEAKNEDIIKLAKITYNYPLALAQFSNEIMMYKGGVDYYLKRYPDLEAKTVAFQTGIVQDYQSNYKDILNCTLQTIEKEDRKAAKFLYMLILLNANLRMDFLEDLFGNDVRKNMVVLERHGVVDSSRYGDVLVLSIHDIVREAATKKLATKDVSYRKEVTKILLKHLNKLYAKTEFRYLNGLDPANDYIVSLYAFVNLAIQNDMLNDQSVGAVITALMLNNSIFNKHTKSSLFDRIADGVLKSNINYLSTKNKALLYANLVFLNHGENVLSFERNMLDLLKQIEKHESSESRENLFCIYTNIAQFYLLLGDMAEAKLYLAKSKKHLDYGDAFATLRFWYINAWFSYEIRDIDEGLRAISNYSKISNQLKLNVLGRLVSQNLIVKFRILAGRIQDANRELLKTIELANVFYNKNLSGFLANMEFSKSLIFYSEGKYGLAEIQCNRTLDIMKKVYGDIGKVIFPQTHVYIMLGKIHEKKSDFRVALEMFSKVLEFYDSYSRGRVVTLYDYGELLSGLSRVYYKEKEFKKSQFFYQKLVTNFGIEHVLVSDLIKKLPREYLQQIGSGKQ